MGGRKNTFKFHIRFLKVKFNLRGFSLPGMAITNTCYTIKTLCGRKKWTSSFRKHQLTVLTCTIGDFSSEEWPHELLHVCLWLLPASTFIKQAFFSAKSRCRLSVNEYSLLLVLKDFYITSFLWERKSWLQFPSWDTYTRQVLNTDDTRFCEKVKK